VIAAILIISFFYKLMFVYETPSAFDFCMRSELVSQTLFTEGVGGAKFVFADSRNPHARAARNPHARAA
jgi:hypothetical protein